MDNIINRISKRSLFTASVIMSAAIYIYAGDFRSVPGKADVGTGNPYLPLWEHLPDGEPRVFEDPDNPGKYRAYIIGSHDMRTGSYCGADVHMWSASVDNLTEWVDEGPIFTHHVDGQWDVMYAPDLVEIKGKDGKKRYYLYPHSRGRNREAMVCVGERPDGPFMPVNLNEKGTDVLPGSFIGFDPSVYVEDITNPADPDYNKGFRAYGFWGFQRSSAAQLDQDNMYAVRPGTETIPYFIPASTPQGEIRDPEGTTYPALYAGQNPKDFNFFEASSIRKVGNKYVMIFSGYSGPEYGIGNSNSTLRYAYGDTPMGPWRAGGVLVDSRGIVPNEDGTALTTTNGGHNTHGSLQEINGQWYVFYHRPPRGFGYSRQAMVAPVVVEWDKKAVSDGGKVTITGYDPYAKDKKWTAKASSGKEYTGAEVTSEGFQIYGMDPYKYISAGYACHLSNNGAMQDSWDVWDNNMDVIMNGGDIVGFKYFGFGGLDKPKAGLKPFEGTKKGNNTTFNVFLIPESVAGGEIEIWLDGPWDNKTWKGRKIGSVHIDSNSSHKVTKYTIDVADAVDKLDGKHGIYLVARGMNNEKIATLKGIGFGKEGFSPEYAAVPAVSIKVDGKEVRLPSTPVRSTNENGYTDNTHYAVDYSLAADKTEAPVVTASCDNPSVKIEILQPASYMDDAIVKFNYDGAVKTYVINLKK